VDDIHEIIKVVKIKPKAIMVYTSPAWKYKMQDIAGKLLAENKLEMSALMQQAMAVPEIKGQAKIAPVFAQKLINDLSKARGTKELVDEKERLDEMEYLKGTVNFLSNNFGCKVQVFSGDDSSVPDPGNKLKQAIPMRPAIYIE
jgi:hypothetical protein